LSHLELLDSNDDFGFGTDDDSSNLDFFLCRLAKEAEEQ